MPHMQVQLQDRDAVANYKWSVFIGASKHIYHPELLQLEESQQKSRPDQFPTEEVFELRVYWL